jgi:RNA polymerase sporulation-specific sigma factor
MTTEQDVERMVEENTGLVAALVGRTLRLFPRLPAVYDREDLYNIGLTGLWRAAQTYDPSRGVAFSTYAYRCIEYAIAGALKRESDRHLDCISLNVLIGADEDSSLEEMVADPGVDLAAIALNRCERDLLERAMELLPAQQANVLRSIYFEGESVPNVAERMGISQQAVQNLHTRALKAMKMCLRRLGMRRPDGG